MKLYDLSILIVVTVIVVAGGIGWISHKWLGNDNPVEQECEKIIKDETGFDIDLTPESPEK